VGTYTERAGGWKRVVCLANRPLSTTPLHRVLRVRQVSSGLGISGALALKLFWSGLCTLKTEILGEAVNKTWLIESATANSSN